ncbi:hypothetical protein ASD78_12130 [Lysobacter sp. Root667]|uniref:hypothetical protein n=1 Tax=Lysobacter sp. Root667 TaxID=1736581 RepID=UPI0006FC03D1|nr:hypothetical protein [Lysobacter sp. Root667]KRA74236.1 hypothetical protein ASD78_12130 [Lysobacter sp. Root667]
MNAAASEVLHPTTTAVAEYSETEAGLAALRQQLANATFDCTTPTGMKLARDSRFGLVKLRTTLENRRKELKAPLLDRGRLLDAEASRITAAILELELPIDEQIKAQERVLEAAKEEAARRERERLAEIQRRIDSLKGFALEHMSAPSSVVKQAIHDLETKRFDPEEWGAHLPDAVEARNASLAKLHEILDHALKNEAIAEQLRAQREAQERRQREEQARLDAERAELDRQQKEARERQEAEERAAAERRRQEDEAAAAERKRQADAAREQQEREDAERRAEQERIAKEQAAERDRLAAERAELERQKAEELAKAEAKRIATTKLTDAAVAAVAYLRDLGQGSHIVTLTLDAAIAREAKPAKATPAPARKTGRKAQAA